MSRQPPLFYASLALAGLLIISGLLVLGLLSQNSTSEQSATGQFITPSAQVEVAPDFSLRMIDGQSIKLSNYRGQVVLLNTWASWCPPCRAEMPNLETYYREHKDKGFVVLAVNDQESATVVTAFLEEHDFTFPVVLDPEGIVMSRYNARSLPTSFFIDREGKIRGVWTGGLTPAHLREIVDPLL